jgi:hypothetical protein
MTIHIQIVLWRLSSALLIKLLVAALAAPCAI